MEAAYSPQTPSNNLTPLHSCTISLSHTLVLLFSCTLVLLYSCSLALLYSHILAFSISCAQDWSLTPCDLTSSHSCTLLLLHPRAQVKVKLSDISLLNLSLLYFVLCMIYTMIIAMVFAVKTDICIFKYWKL